MPAAQATRWEDVHYRQATIVDLHVHPGLKASLFRRQLTQRFQATRQFDPFSVRADFGKLKDAGVDVILSSIYAPEPQILDECGLLRFLVRLMPITYARVFKPPRFKVTMDMIDTMEKQVRAGTTARLACSVRELEACLAAPGDRPVAVVHNVEGGHSLDGSLDNLQALFNRGVAYLTLAHFYPNAAVHPVFPYPETMQHLECFRRERDLTLGLTPFGEEVVEKMVELGMILDVSHCTPPARRRIYDIVGRQRPLIASHVGAYEINPSPYNLRDWEIRRIAETGGVVGVIFMNYWLMPHETARGINYIARTIEHVANVGGIDHVGLGTDFDGFTDPPDDLKDMSELPRLTQRLVADEYSAGDVAKILGGNALRVLREGWGKKE